MAIPVLIIGRSGSGKSASMRNLDPAKTGVINVINKPLPFKSSLRCACTDDYTRINSIIASSKTDVVVIDDAGYLMTNMFMRGHANPGKGNDIFGLYNNIGDNFWTLINNIVLKPSQQRFYIMMHEDINDLGLIKPKSIGKLVDEKVCLEGLFTICLRCRLSCGRHVFSTQTDGYDTAKSPMGMFEDAEIDNDLALVDKAICDYYEITEAFTKKEPKKPATVTVTDKLNINKEDVA